MPKTIVTPIQKRFSDADMFHHINNAVQQTYFDLGKIEFLHNVLSLDEAFDRVSLITVAVANNFYRQIRQENDIEVSTTVRKVGNKSVTLFQQIVDCADGEPMSDSLTTMVAFDTKAQTSVPVSAEWRDKLLG